MAIELHSRIMRGDADRRAHVREIKRLTQDLAKRDSEKETLSVEVQEASERVSRLEQENEALGIECFRQFGKLDRRCKVSRLPLRGKKISMSLVKEQSCVISVSQALEDQCQRLSGEVIELIGKLELSQVEKNMFWA